MPTLSPVRGPAHQGPAALDTFVFLTFPGSPPASGVCVCCPLVTTLMFISSCCSDKIPQARWHKTTRFLPDGSGGYKSKRGLMGLKGGEPSWPFPGVEAVCVPRSWPCHSDFCFCLHLSLTRTLVVGEDPTEHCGITSPPDEPAWTLHGTTPAAGVTSPPSGGG